MLDPHQAHQAFLLPQYTGCTTHAGTLWWSPGCCSLYLGPGPRLPPPMQCHLHRHLDHLGARGGSVWSVTLCEWLLASGVGCGEGGCHLDSPKVPTSQFPLDLGEPLILSRPPFADLFSERFCLSLGFSRRQMKEKAPFPQHRPVYGDPRRQSPSPARAPRATWGSWILKVGGLNPRQALTTKRGDER